MDYEILPPHFTLIGSCSESYDERLFSFCGRLNSREYRGHAPRTLSMSGCEFGDNKPGETMLFTAKFRRWAEGDEDADDGLPPVDFNSLPDGEWIEEVNHE